MKVTDELERALEDGLRCSHALPCTLRAMRDAMAGQPGAQSYDNPVVGGHRTVLDDEGIPMPALSDPTGEAAVTAAQGQDQASIDHRDTLKDIHAVAVIFDRMTTRFARYQPRSATDKERRETERANDPTARGCELCQRAGHWHPPFTDKPTDVAGVLDEPYLLCEWHWRFVRKMGRLTTEQETAAYVSGRPVKVSA